MPSSMKTMRKKKSEVKKTVSQTSNQAAVDSTRREEKGEKLALKLGSSGEKVKKLQACLKQLGFFGSAIDGDFGPLTEESVEKFQTKNKILVDGIVGPGTVYEIDRLLTDIGQQVSGLMPSEVENFSQPSKKLRWLKCPADVFQGRGGYGSLTLRSDTAKAYRDLYDDVHALGGIITTAGGKRSLDSKTSPSRSKKSMHYVVLAFDLALPTAMQDAKKDPYVVVDVGNREWEVWCRTSDKSVPTIELEATLASTRNGKTKLRVEKVKGRFFSFTELANQHGFMPIRARKSFFRGGSYTGAEWWHFQWESALATGKSKFGEELLKIYPMEKCKRFHYWDQVKNCIFGIDWF